MEDLVSFAFKNLVSRFDELTVIEPRTLRDLSDVYQGLQIIHRDFEELVRVIEKVASTSED